MICINANCRKPAFICEHGLNSNSECALFHEKCEKMKWSELENIICENPNIKIPELFNLQEEMEILFSNLIKKVKELNGDSVQKIKLPLTYRIDSVQMTPPRSWSKQEAECSMY